MYKQETVANVLKKLEGNKPKGYENYSPAIFRIHRIHDYLHLDLESVLVKYDLQLADFGVLTTLRKEKQPCCLSPTELYNHMLFSSGGLTKVLCRVEKAGLIDRIDNPDDKRSKLVQLTERGMERIDKVLTNLHLIEQKKMAVLSKQEQQQFDTLLEKLLSVWE